MAPLNLMTAGVRLLAKSFSVLSCTSSLARCTSILPAAYVHPVKCLTSQASGPPKKPMNGYLRFLAQQRPVITRQNPEIKAVDVTRNIAHQWRMLSPEQKRPFEEASLRAKEQFKVDLQRYQAQLTPAQVQQQALEKRQRMEKRKAIRKKRELTKLGKPKRPRTPFNIYISEHMDEARGVTLPAKFKSLLDDWKNLFSHQRQVYMQLAEDDKVRYNNEMKSWEDNMLEIGREDLIREQTLSKKVRAAKTLVAKKAIKKAVVKAEKKKATAKGKSKTSRKTTKSSSTTKNSSTKTARTTKKT